MKVQVFLADAAQADPSGKINALGLGWRSCPTPVPAFALVIILDVDWDETNKRHKLTVELVDHDGRATTATGPFGPQPIRFEAVAEAGRAPGSVRGMSVRLPLSISVGAGLQLEPGLYSWRVSVEGFPDSTATETFHVYPGPQQQQPPPAQQPPTPND